jgi:hypothetical protein
MELSDVETRIAIKNMARETVKRATAKNAMRGAEVTYKTDDGKTGSYRTSINGTDEEIKAYFRPGTRINIGDGPRDKMAIIQSVKILNAVAKNAPPLWRSGKGDAPQTVKETTYFKSYTDAANYAKAHNLPTDRILNFQRGWAIQFYVSGPYVDITKDNFGR